MYRIEKDQLGELQIPKDALWGIHTARALQNFPLNSRAVPECMIRSYGVVKHAALACCVELNCFQSKAKAEALTQAALELSEGKLSESIVVTLMQGGAGTSLNMNINEVIANRALQILGEEPGNYELVSPIDDVNRYQSTNDTFPTALKIAAINQIHGLEEALVELQESFQQKEQEFADVVKIGRTQYQDAVLTTLGREMGAYAEAISRDRWRVYKCVERLRTVNIGGTAIGSGISAERRYIFQVVEKLRELSGIGLARAENLVEATQNADVFAEVSGILKACAASFIKISGDIRLMSSGPTAGLAEITIPPKQAGSSIMPHKVNPVIPEFTSTCAMQVIANDVAITQAVAAGSLELNPFLPLIASNLLESIELLTKAALEFSRKCISEIAVKHDVCRKQVENSTAVLTALVHRLGYEQCTQLANQADEENKSVKEIIITNKVLSEDEFEQLISPESVSQLGFRKP